MFDTDRYLDRIGYRGERSPSAAALAELQRQHLLTVPFESLDIHRGHPLSLKTDLLFDKIVTRERGGFCYELNGLFALLLTSLGYEVTRISARVFNDAGEPGPEFDHLALLVEIQGRWLVDVGFGDSFDTPLELDSAEPQRRGRTDYRIERRGDHVLYAQRHIGDEAFVDQYAFSLRARTLSDFEPMCRYHQTSPDSPFTKRSICTRLTDDGRITLRTDELIRTRDGTRTTTPVESKEAWRDALRAHFGVVLPGPASGA